MTLLERVARARDKRREAEAEFRQALRNAKAQHSWQELADVAHLSRHGCRWLVLDLNERRKQNEARVQNARQQKASKGKK